MRGSPQLELNAEILTFQNWEGSAADGYTSLPDPMIYIERLQVPVDTITITTDLTPLPSEYTLFYTTEAGEGFNAEKMLTLAPVTGKDRFDLGLWVESIRIDPGEEAGTALHEFTLLLNDARWHISVSRIVAMLVIWWGTAGLMALQRPADYGIRQKEGMNDEA